MTKDILYIASEGKALSERETIEDCHVREGTTIEVSQRLQGGTKDEEMKASAE